MKKKTEVSFKSFDMAAHIVDPATFLTAAIEDASGDPAIILSAINIAARARNMSELARECNISREGLYRALAPGGNPSFATVTRLMELLGVHLTAVSAK